MSEIKLLPCPCCKGISILDEAGAEIRCIDCGLTMSIANCFSIQGGWKQAVEEAVTKWNTRRPLERIVERLEEKEREVNKKRLNATEPLEHEFLDGKSTGYEEAIQVVKEVGESNVGIE